MTVDELRRLLPDVDGEVWEADVVRAEHAEHVLMRHLPALLDVVEAADAFGDAYSRVKDGDDHARRDRIRAWKKYREARRQLEAL